MSLPTKIHPLKRATARRFASTNTLGAENHDQRLLGLLCNLRELSTERVSYPRKITKNRAFYRFWALSIEMIEEKTREKVIHSQFISLCSNRRNPPLWTDSGCPDKYMKTQCN
jgi:hypothetical protein